MAVASANITTAGEPAAIEVTVDWGENLKANGQDCALIRATIVDSKGLFVPCASMNLIQFEASGGDAVVVGVGGAAVAVGASAPIPLVLLRVQPPWLLLLLSSWVSTLN